MQQLEPIASYERDSWLDKLIDQIHKQTIGTLFVEKAHIEEALKVKIVKKKFSRIKAINILMTLMLVLPIPKVFICLRYYYLS